MQYHENHDKSIEEIRMDIFIFLCMKQWEMHIHNGLVANYPVIGVCECVCACACGCLMGN